ncbi:MAG TPA: sulfite exporter TauE/SafE family protein [Pseudobacteroides sp.]|uniref:urease accessory protein UreH domain-containing protein n=1 Tax=Pseudobacteroides sp. TaxID=1968840 RepID=UPI002F92146B
MSLNNKQKTLHIEGMTCTSCEMRIENVLMKLEGMIEAKAIYSSSSVYVTYDSSRLGIGRIIETIEKLDYKVKSEASSISETDERNKEYKTKVEENRMRPGQVIGIGVIILALYLIINNTIGFNFIPEVNQSMGYGILFVVGLLTSLHCIAMCGGINLSVCVQYKLGSNEKDMDREGNGRGRRLGELTRLTPSALYNLGRVISYTIIGGIVGALGSVVSFSGTVKGIIAIVSGIFMVIMGLNMLNIFPWLRKINPRMPKIFGKKIHGNTGKKGPIVIGLLNGLMPCGPLQAMQLYALGTGSMLAGALSMFLFSIGTVPLMFGFGAISSLLSGKFTHKMLKVSAVLVMILGVIMLNRGFNLSGYNIGLALGSSGGSRNIAKIDNGEQVVTINLEPGGYTPIVVQKDIPVKWIIKADKESLNGCNNAITSQEFGIENEKLIVGDNIIEFTPKREGTFVYTCWMGMISSSIKVVPDITKVQDKDINDAADPSGQSGSIGGGCCGASSKATKFIGGKVPVDEVSVGRIKDGIQDVSFSVNDYGFSPAVIVMQKGVKTNFVINGEQLNYCNNRLVFPEYNSQMTLKNGENKIEFVPEADFTFKCWMGMLNGYVKVVDDVNKINLDEIKNEIKGYKPASGSSGGGGCCG